MNMNIAVIDADLIGRKRHRFPNLACMKISGYHKANGDTVILKTSYDALDAFDKVYVAKVFTDTQIPSDGLFGDPLDLPNVIRGGTGFFYDNAPPLPPEIEHSMPDYHLYDEWAGSGVEFKAYHDYSIGFLTRGCFRHCPFCVNRRSNRVVKHSPLREFLDNSRKKICLLDDNFFGYENCDGDYIFAFDDWQDRELIEQKMQLIRRYHHSKQRVKFYTLCAYDRRGLYDESFWQRDLRELAYRMRLLKAYDFLPYVMRFEKYKDSPYRACYVDLAAYGNQPRFFGSKMPFVEFAVRHRGGKPSHPFNFELQKILEG